MPEADTAVYAVRLKGVTKAFGRAPALRGVDLDLPWGKTLSLLGPNGSGKTTIIKIIATLTRADSGDVHIAGARVGRDGARARRMIGVVTHDPLLYEDLTARENLRFFCRMFSLDDIEDRIERVAETMGTTARLDQRIGAMSHGMKKRFGIARALLHEPPILLLDEPDSGLDQEALGLLDEVIGGGDNPRRAVIMTTHNLERAIALGDVMAIIAGGRVAHRQTLDAADADAAREAYERLASR